MKHHVMIANDNNTHFIVDARKLMSLTDKRSFSHGFRTLQTAVQLRRVDGPLDSVIAHAVLRRVNWQYIIVYRVLEAT